MHPRLVRAGDFFGNVLRLRLLSGPHALPSWADTEERFAVEAYARQEWLFFACPCSKPLCFAPLGVWQQRL